VSKRQELLDQRGCELRIVDVQRQPLDPAFVSLHERLFEFLEQRRVGDRIVKQLAGGIEHRHAEFGDQ